MLFFTLQIGWDVIRLFRLDDPNIAPGIRVVQGSNELQKAYKLTRNNQLQAPTR